eukprot:CAMPEP_0194512556 /NCGR_PEP_ID=MMETSP0253-20130528/44577_1 /TAXON_ID=2966 /ORGANISM="Noctiluca scintillans" /LENGTH=198 /DNA_ID=CAMNT_0039356021 /DNA_START=84 /DNA_END=683 /DNA_ORIENTATION=-
MTVPPPACPPSEAPQLTLCEKKQNSAFGLTESTCHSGGPCSSAASSSFSGTTPRPWMTARARAEAIAAAKAAQHPVERLTLMPTESTQDERQAVLQRNVVAQFMAMLPKPDTADEFIIEAAQAPELQPENLVLGCPQLEDILGGDKESQRHAPSVQYEERVMSKANLWSWQVWFPSCKPCRREFDAGDDPGEAFAEPE